MGIIIDLTTGVMVYLSLIICLVGITFQVYRWVMTPASTINLGLFPKSQGRVSGTLIDMLVLPEVLEINKPMWLVAFFMHLAAPLVLLGHIKLLPGIPDIGFVEVIMGALGLGLALSVLYLLITKFTSPYKQVCAMEDYFLMGLLLAAVLSGLNLHYFSDIPTSAVQDYMGTLLALQPELSQEILNSSYRGIFVLHVLLANLVLLYFPFSKLVYWLVGSIYTGAVRRG